MMMLNIYVCLKIISTIIIQLFFTFITQHFESWLLQVKISTFITWNLDLVSWNISWGKLKALNGDFDNSKYPIINSKSKFWITKSLLGEKVTVVFWVF